MNFSNLSSDKKIDKKDFFAEVIESGLDSFTAQSWQWDMFPTFGSLVQVVSDGLIILGCVSHVTTGSTDPMRFPFPYQKTEEELRVEQPQIFEFLKTSFRVQILGYGTRDGSDLSTYHYLLPPHPPKIHTFVQNAGLATYESFFQKNLYLHVLFAFSANLPNIDEVLLALLHQLSQRNMLAKKQLEEFCQAYSLLTGNDYRRLKLFLKRAERFIMMP